MNASRGSQQIVNGLRGPFAIATSAALFAFTALSGCGGSSSTTASRQATQASESTTSSASSSQAAAQPSTAGRTSTAAPAESEHQPEPVPTTEKIVLSSRAIDPRTRLLQTRYTCDGQDVALPLRWEWEEGMPPGTAELMIDVIRLKAVDKKIQFVWAVTHLPPTAHEIVAGKLPRGAVVGTNSRGEVGYHLCPPKPHGEEGYAAVIFALPQKLPAKTGFDPRELRHEAERHAKYQYILTFGYKRR